jgi:repressor of nif and glnA expression
MVKQELENEIISISNKYGAALTKGEYRVNSKEAYDTFNYSISNGTENIYINCVFNKSSNQTVVVNVCTGKYVFSDDDYQGKMMTIVSLLLENKQVEVRDFLFRKRLKITDEAGTVYWDQK